MIGTSLSILGPLSSSSRLFQQSSPTGRDETTPEDDEEVCKRQFQTRVEDYADRMWWKDSLSSHGGVLLLRTSQWINLAAKTSASAAEKSTPKCRLPTGTKPTDTQRKRMLSRGGGKAFVVSKKSFTTSNQSPPLGALVKQINPPPRLLRPRILRSIARPRSLSHTLRLRQLRFKTILTRREAFGQTPREPSGIHI